MADNDSGRWDAGDRAAERMHRHADRIHQRAERMRGRVRRHCGPGGTPPAFFGLLLLAMGALFLLDNLNIIEARYVWRTFWPLLFIGWGVSRVIAGGHDRFLPWLAIGGGSLLLGRVMFGWNINLARVFWPVVLMALGLHILYRSWRRPATVHASAGEPGVADFTAGESGAAPDASASFRDSAFLGSVERRSVSQAFRGGDATAFMGSVAIDLRESRMASNEAVVDVSVIMGSIELRIPRGWTVESRVSALLGSFEDLTDPPLEMPASRLVIRGSALMGSVEVRN
jgi:predicted membrane protein